MTSFLCHCSRVDRTPLLTIPRKRPREKSPLVHWELPIGGILRYVRPLYHIFSQNQSLMASQNGRSVATVKTAIR
jgi:hypothetical protein